MAELDDRETGQSTVMGISLLILILAAVPTLANQSFSGTAFGLFLTGVVTAVIFGALNNQGHGWDSLGTVQILTLVLITVAVLNRPLVAGMLPGGAAAGIGTLFVVLTFLFALYAVYGLFTSEDRLPNMSFLFIAVMVGAGATIGIVGTVLVTLAALVTIFAWPHVRSQAPAEI